MTKEAAIAAAKAVAEERGWTWEGRIAAETTVDGIEVRSNVDMLGTNVVVVVGFDGAIKRAGYNPR